MKIRKLLFGIMPCMALSFAQDPSANMGAASLGLIYDASAGVSRVLGIPGAASIAKPIDIGFELKSVALPPREDYLLAVDAAESAVYVVGLHGGSTDPQRIAGLDSGPNRIEFSPSGNRAAIYYAGAGKVSLVSGLPDRPSVRDIDVSIAGSPATSIAVSDRGMLALGAPAGDEAAVWVLSGGILVQVADVREATSIAFVPRSNTAYVADRLQNAVFRWEESRGDLALVASEADGLAEPAFVGVSTDSRRLLVANPGAQSVAVIDMNTGERSALQCSCVVSALHRMSGSSFRLTEVEEGVAWLLDAESRTPRIVFVATPQPITVGAPE